MSVSRTIYQHLVVRPQWSVRLQEVVGGAPGAVAALAALAPLPRVALASACGRLFLVSTARPEAESSFVVTELGTATELCCLAAAPSPHGIEVWAGGDSLYSYTVTNEGVSAADTLDSPRISLLAALDPGGAGGVGGVVGVGRGETVVRAWKVGAQQSHASLDCSKLAPCSESLQSIALDDEDDAMRLDRCRVTAVAALGQEVVVGTAWGCVVVAHAHSLRPLTVFRPYEEEVRALVPLPAHGRAPPLLASLGAGYRPLVQRYAPAQSNNNNQTYSGNYCLLWRTGQWLPD